MSASQTPHARLEHRADGYVRWRDYDPVEKRERYVYVHQLCCIAAGADPEKVFSDGRWHVHHIDGFKFHNTPENVELRDRKDHSTHHDHLAEYR